jgi:hypothetical protein
MTEPEAWREIARRIVEGDWKKCGLCREAGALHENDKVTTAVFRSMSYRVRQHVAYCDSAVWGWAYRMGTEPEARALAALWLALEAEEEGA